MTTTNHGDRHFGKLSASVKALGVKPGDKQFCVLAGLTVFVVAVAYGPLLVEFFANQWLRPHYQYFPFVIGAFVEELGAWSKERGARVGE